MSPDKIKRGFFFRKTEIGRKLEVMLEKETEYRASLITLFHHHFYHKNETL